ncbi:uncharacterized protein TNCV_1909711 [Trichonephila clavipes]|nr:uncharacterized protein TNCV_1909711 [Trichonephila clavipes]
MLLNDKCSFNREGIFNVHNWTYTNSHAICPHSYQWRFSVNVWAGIFNDHLIWLYLLTRHPGRWNVSSVLQQELLVILKSVPANIKARIWLQHDGAPAHFNVDVRSALDTTYPGPLIGRGGLVNWPALSHDLSCPDFFFWGHMKNPVYARTVDSDEALVASIAVLAGDK